MPATIDDPASIEAIELACETWMATLPEDRRIVASSKRFMEGFTFVTKDATVNDAE
jgi:hypothetical protein